MCRESHISKPPIIMSYIQIPHNTVFPCCYIFSVAIGMRVEDGETLSYARVYTRKQGAHRTLLVREHLQCFEENMHQKQKHFGTIQDSPSSQLRKPLSSSKLYL